MTNALFDVQVPGAKPVHEGKVRSVFDLGRELLIVATDRVSAYDVVIPTPIPDKGRVLTQISEYWFDRLSAASPHHCLSTKLSDFPEPFRSVPALDGRSMLCRKTDPVKVECIVRGYLAGSGFREYRDHGTLNGEKLPAGLENGSKFDEPRFTPSTKAEEGHDEAMTWQEYKAFLGEPLASQLRDRTLALYTEAAPQSEQSGMILVDSKFEFGIVDGEVLLIDECFSPDSSRYWDAGEYAKGNLVSFDKQYLRDALDRTGWDRSPPAPELDEATVRALHTRYLEAIRRLMGEERARESGLLGATAE